MWYTMNMLVEYQSSPAAIGTRTPRFSWEVPSSRCGTRQSAYRILVGSDRRQIENGVADLWDSGRVESSRSTNVAYAGKPLRSNQDCFWTVRLWSERGDEITVGRIEYFGTALYDASDWHGEWIGLGDPDEPFADPASFQQERVSPEVQAVEHDPRAPLLRRAFTVDRPVARARAFVCGLGLFELRLNGGKVGHEVLSPPRTEFRTRALYSTFDITGSLRSGENVLGLILGNGWFNGQKKYWGWQMQWYGTPRAIAEVVIEYDDGTEQRVTSDRSWRGAWSPVTSNCLFDGEEYDARLEHDGWDAPGFADGAWQAVNVVPTPGGVLHPANCEPELVTDTIRPVAVTEPLAGTYVYDLGVNMTGWVRIRIRGGSAGTVVTLRYAEAVDHSGMLDTKSQGTALQRDVFTTRGSAEQTYEPRFTYHGFRYVEVTSYPGPCALEDLQGRFARVAVERSGTFACSNELIDRIHRAALQSQLCNIQMGVPTDDTQRPERLGWGADGWATATAELHNLWMPNVYAKWIADFRDQQDELGMIGMIAPQAGSEEDLVWSSVFLLIPWWQYVHHGDTRILEENYESFRRYLAYLERCGVDRVTAQTQAAVIESLFWRCGPEGRFPAQDRKGVLQISQWGDHLATAEGSLSRTNLPLSIATAFYYLDVTTMARIARVLGRDGDAVEYERLAGRIRTAFNDRFYDANLGYYDGGVQSAQAWPIAFGLVADDQRTRVGAYLCDHVGRRQRHLTTGYAATKFAIHALSALGRDDLVWQLATATGYPGWAYMLRNDRTTSCENWDGERGSLNHAPLGAAIDEWFYWGLAGIRPDETAPGFERIIVKPYIPRDLDRVSASIRTARGEVAAGWRRESGRVTITVIVPGNSSAAVHVPAPTAAIEFDRFSPEERECLSVLHADDSSTVLSVESGTWHIVYVEADE